MTVLVRGIAAACVLACGLAPTGAAAQTDLTAGKTPAQMFSSDCAACHRSPSGLSRGRDPSGVARFLRDHYTSSPGNAGALAGYLAGAGGGAAAPDPRGRQRPQAGQEERPDPRAGAAAAPGQRQPRQAPAEAEAAPAPTTPQQRQRQAAPPPEGQPAAERPAPRRSNERLASTPLDRLRPYIAAHDPAPPAPAGEADRRQRITDYATAGTTAEALRAAALAVRPAPAAPPVAAPDARAARPPEAAERPGPGAAATPPAEASATAPGTAPSGATPAGEGAAAEAPVAGPPVGSAAPTRQSNEDPR